MLTTLLNPTLWLLAATGLSAAHAVRHGQDGRQALARVIRYSTATPALAAIVLLAAGGFASRVALGLLSPGAYAEEVLGARAFLEGGQLYGGGDARRDLTELVAEAAVPVEPWTLPGITPCQGSAMADRARYYTSQGHPPTMLLASVPVVMLLGGQGLYLTLVVMSCMALLAAAGALRRLGGVAPNTRAAVLVVAALAAWQPVLAAVRQGEALVIVAALSVVAWGAVRDGAARAGFLGGIAAMMTLPALALVPALLRVRLKAGLVAAATLAGGVLLVMAAGGPTILPDFVALLAPSASTYAQAANNYAVVGRVLTGGPAVAPIAFIAAALLSLWRGRSVDGGFASWLALGLLAAPIVWSQHLALALVPLLVLLKRALDARSAAPLALWSALAVLISAPDPLVAWLHALAAAAAPAAVLPVVSVALLAQWAWIVMGPDPAPVREAGSTG